MSPSAGGEATEPTGFGCAAVFVLIGLVVAVAAAVGLSTAFRAVRGDGIRGVLTVQTRDCGDKTGCSWTGPFVSDDGGLRLAHVETTDLPDGTDPGERAAVIDVDGDFYAADGSTEWLAAALLVLVGVAIAAGAIWSWWASGHPGPRRPHPRLLRLHRPGPRHARPPE